MEALPNPDFVFPDFIWTAVNLQLGWVIFVFWCMISAPIGLCLFNWVQNVAIWNLAI